MRLCIAHCDVGIADRQRVLCCDGSTNHCSAIKARLRRGGRYVSGGIYIALVATAPAAAAEKR
jgi:hypothetical protein